MKKSNVIKKISECLRCNGGNFAMMGAVALPMLFMAGSLALDTTNVISMKTRLQNAVDSAALATATRLYNEKNLSEEDAKIFAAEFLRGQVEEDSKAFDAFTILPTINITPVTDKSGTTWIVDISVKGTQSATSLAKFMGRDTLDVTVSSQTQSGSETSQGSISMALVLDKSGSMGWKLDGEVKMQVLKTAVFGLIKLFQDVDPDRKYIRLGAVTYDSNRRGHEDMFWNPNRVRKFTAGLKANGGTDSTDAFKWAYEAVISPTENGEHLGKTGQEPEPIVVFMTDGDNNYNSADTSTKKLCDQAKADGVTIYTIAFAAPTRGQELLSYCASEPENYFDAKNAQDLIDAFKTIGEQSSQIVSRLTR